MQDMHRNTQRLVPRLTRPGAKGRPKARTGCLSCKQRRKKCDEARPQCGACAREGWECEFPSVKTIATRPRRRRPLAVAFGSATIAWPSLLPQLTSQELKMFNFCAEQGMISLDLILSNPGVDVLLIKMAIYEPCVRQAVLAVGYALWDSYWPAADRAGRARDLERLLQHYNLAIREMAALRAKEDEESKHAVVKRTRPDRLFAIICASLLLASADHISAYLSSTVLGEQESAGKSRTIFHLRSFCAMVQDSRSVSLIDDGGRGAWDRKSQLDDDIAKMTRLASTYFVHTSLYDEEVERFKAQNPSAGSCNNYI